MQNREIVKSASGREKKRVGIIDETISVAETTQEVTTEIST